MLKKTIRDVKLEGKRVLVRVDFNVPLDIRTGAIANGNRIKYTLPTINYLVNHDARVILCSHLGRPNGKIVKELSLKQVAERLSELIQLIHLPVPMVSDCIGDEVKKAVDELKDGQILLLQNLRFHPEEEANDPQFAKALAENADIYVDDAFGTAHRAHASTVGVTKYLPSYFGFLMEREVEALGRILASPEYPFAALLGGAKVSDKISLIENILSKLDSLLIGGGMAANFLKAKGYDVGKSKVEVDKMDLALRLIDKIEKNHIKLFLPVDVVVADSTSDKATGEVVAVAKIPADKYIVDIGPQTIEAFSEQLRKCKTIFWNGPMGIFEIEQFSNGTKALVNLLSDVKASTIVGGGSTAEVVEEMDMTNKFTHVSTGGGASLEFLEGKVLPAIDALQNK